MRSKRAATARARPGARRPRRAAGLTLGVALVASLLAGAGAHPAAAQSQEPGGYDHPVPLAGNFVGGPAEELFVYWPGPTGPDRLMIFARDPGGTVTTTAHPFPVSGTYQPVAGDIDGDGLDEILWYGPGAAADYVWDFTGPTTVATRAITVGGFYSAVAGDLTGDGADDVVWYAPGTGADRLWEFDPGGGRHDLGLAVNGYYQPVVGSFGADATDDILWYAYVPAQGDSLWDFRPGGTPAYTSVPTPVAGQYDPFALDMWAEGPGGGDIAWYGFGADPDQLWNFVGGTRRTAALAVGGYYYPHVPGDFFGDGSDDILWFTDEYPNVARVINVWEHTLDGATLVRTRYQLDRAAWLGPGAAALTATAPVLGRTHPAG